MKEEKYIHKIQLESTGQMKKEKRKTESKTKKVKED